MSDGLGLAAYCVAFYFGAGLAMCLGYHRVLSHRSLVLPKGLERFLVTLGLPAGTPAPAFAPPGTEVKTPWILFVPQNLPSGTPPAG